MPKFSFKLKRYAVIDYLLADLLLVFSVVRYSTIQPQLWESSLTADITTTAIMRESITTAHLLSLPQLLK